MATLAVFSTLTADILAQGSSVASMTIRATVVESASIQAVNDLRFTETSFNDNQFISQTDGFAEFVITGTRDAEISVTVSSQSMLSEEASSVVFTPSLVSGNGLLSQHQTIQLKSDSQSGQSRASVWVEGKIESPTQAEANEYIGQYLIDAVYN
ncbi:MAG: hypothetical protein LAT52_04080 [Balneolales bacterium]|nr:hypothetical protein [Balneolales bacterium]